MFVCWFTTQLSAMAGQAEAKRRTPSIPEGVRDPGTLALLLSEGSWIRLGGRAQPQALPADLWACQVVD